MTTIQIADSTYEKLAARAARLGVSIETVLEQLMYVEPEPLQGTPEERIAKMKAFIESLPRRKLTLDDSRDSIYDDDKNP